MHFGLRNWPDDGSANDLEWTLSDSDTKSALVPSGGGFGGGISPDRIIAFDGSWWFKGVAHSDLRLRCLLGRELLIDVEIGTPLDEVPSPITRMERLDGSTSEHRSIVEGLIAAGWRSGKAVADEFVAIEAQPETVDHIEAAPISIERWDQLIRVTVAMTGADRLDDPPCWWSVRFGHHCVPALCERSQSGRTTDLISHLVMIDPTSHRPLHQIGS